MPRLPAFAKSLAGKGMATKAPMPVLPTGGKMSRVAMGGVPDQAPQMDKAKALLAGVPMSVRGKKPRLGGL